METWLCEKGEEIGMKKFKHFIIRCLDCGAVWEENTAEGYTACEYKKEVAICEECPSKNIEVTGVETRRNG